MKHFNKVLRGAALNIADLVLKVAVTMVITPLMIRSLGLSGYGLWLLVMSVAGYCALLDLGISFAGARFAAAAIGSGDVEQESLVIGAVGRYFRRIAWVILLGAPLVAWMTGQWVSVDDHWEVEVALFIVLVTMAIRFSFRKSLVVLRAEVRHDLVAVPSILRNVLQSVALFEALRWHAGIIGVAVVQFGGELVEQALLRGFAARYLGARAKVSEHALEMAQIGREMRSFAANVSLIMAGEAMRMQTTPFIVNYHRGVEAVPIYSVGMRLLTMLQDVVGAIFGGTILSTFSQLHGAGDSKTLRELFLKYSELAAGFSVCGVLGCVWLAPAFFNRWVGPDFEPASQVMLILALPFALHFAQYPAHNLLYSLNQSAPLAKLSLYGGAVSAVLCFSLGGVWGVNGIVAGMGIEMMFSRLVVVPWLIQKIAGVSVLRYLTYYLAWPAVKTLLLPACCAYLLHADIKADYGHLAWLGFVYVLVSALSFLLFAVRGEDRQAMWRRMRKR